MKSTSLNLLIVHSAFLVTEGLVFPKYNGVQDRFEQLHSEIPEFRKELVSSNTVPSYSTDNVHIESKEPDPNDYFPTVYTPELNPYVSDNDASDPKYVQFHANIGGLTDNSEPSFDNFNSYDGFTSPEEPVSRSTFPASNRRPYHDGTAVYGIESTSSPMGFAPKEFEHKSFNDEAPLTHDKLIERSSKPDNCEESEILESSTNQKNAYNWNKTDRQVSENEAYKEELNEVLLKPGANAQSNRCYSCEKLAPNDSPILDIKTTLQAPAKEYIKDDDKDEAECSEDYEKDEALDTTKNWQYQKSGKLPTRPKLESIQQLLRTKSKKRRNKAVGSNNRVNKKSKAQGLETRPIRNGSSQDLAIPIEGSNDKFLDVNEAKKSSAYYGI